MKRDAELRLIAEVARGGAGRSPLYRWLRARHDAFAELLDETRPRWRTLADGFNDLGLAGAGGQALTPETARHTWWRVRRDVAAARARRGISAPPPAVVPAAHTVPAAAPPSPTPSPAPPPGAAQSALARLMAEMDERSGRKRNG